MNASPAVPPLDCSPIRLNYVAALRGIKPRKPETGFTYAACVDDPADLLCLAASNPEGRFYGLLPSEPLAKSAREQAQACSVDNIEFFGESVLPKFAVPKLDYLVVDEAVAGPARTARFELAKRHMKAGGFFVYRYRAYPDSEGILRFLINDLSPEMDGAQSNEFLRELKALSPAFFESHTSIQTALNLAIAQAKPDNFFELFESKPATSGAIDVMEALLPENFAFVGDADLASNYLELTTPSSAHDLLLRCRRHVLYEPIKDFAMQRLVRNDIWVKAPVEQTMASSELWSPFVFGITRAPHEIPSSLTLAGQTVRLDGKPFASWLELLKILPARIGDFLNHPLGKGVKPAEAITAIQTLAALGLVQPMRGENYNRVNTENKHPRWAIGYNRLYGDKPITNARVQLASPIVGSPFSVPARDALVMQAISRVGLNESAAALLPELKRLAQDPALAAQIMDVAEPTDETARNMIQSVVQTSLVQWYAYGLLAA